MAGQTSKPLERYFSTLELLAEVPAGMTLVDIAARLDLPGATTHRVINALLEAGLVTRGVSDRHYVLGPRARRFGTATLSGTTLEDRVGNIVDKLSRKLEQTIFIVRLTTHEAETILVREPASGEAIVHPGRIMALHAGATGKAILAYQTEAAVEDFLKTPRRRFTADTKVSREDILAELSLVRGERFATCDNEMDTGVLSYATPIFAADGSVSLALGTCGLKSRFSSPGRAEVREMLIDSAAEISRRLGNAA
ncbi:IclR family transcriptional regulator [Chachezhania sediminis]|uniref:IclR family transcriptional regulator n=1 Tax=Chachezhania sediminis TaxID=2599291 RepID=UPI00131C0B84|nr:IclR family transcriptional regulator [Chachezhania sediminis]